MSSNALVGFIVGNVEKLGWCQDGDYSSVGVEILRELRDLVPNGIDNLRMAAKAVEMVSGKASRAQIKECIWYLNMSVYPSKIDEWYCLLFAIFYTRFKVYRDCQSWVG